MATGLSRLSLRSFPARVPPLTRSCQEKWKISPGTIADTGAHVNSVARVVIAFREFL